LQSLVDDLVDFNRTNLGHGLSIAPVKVELAQLLSECIERASGSGCTLLDKSRRLTVATFL
jgi:hypothetical protein